METVATPDIIGKSIKEAKKILKENGLEFLIENETNVENEISTENETTTNNINEELDEENTVIINQTPKPGIIVNKQSKVYVNY